MNTQDTQALEAFLNQLVQARGIAKDPQADSLITRAVAQQPDAAYLLVQRALLVERALDNAKAQIASLQSQLQAAQSPPGRGFLEAEPWGNSPGNSAGNGMRAPAYAPAAPAYNQAPSMQSAAPAPASPGFFSGGMRGALGTAAATAAGVAGSAFLFQGIEHMMHPGGGFMNQSGMGSSFMPPVENTTINNYYDDGDTSTTSGSDLDFLSSDNTDFGNDSLV